MKKFFLLIVLFIPGVIFSQEISFEKKGTTSLKLKQIQDVTNTFITQKWDNTNLMFQNISEKLTTITGMKEAKLKCATGEEIYTITYVVNFNMENNSYDIQVTDVTCVEGNLLKGTRVLAIPKVQPKFNGTSDNKKVAGVTEQLTDFFKKIITDYQLAMSSTN